MNLIMKKKKMLLIIIKIENNLSGENDNDNENNLENKINSVENKINNFKFSSFGFINNKFCQKLNLLKFCSLVHKNMNKIIVEKFEKFKDFNTNSIF